MTAEHKHTEGPWRAICDPLHFDSLTDVADAGGGLIASMCGVNPERTVFEMEANARLIAAAPDLLAMLKVAQLWLDVDGRYDMQGINAAIAKAEGRS